MMTTSRQLDTSRPDSISYDSDESNLTPRDTGVLQTVMEEGLTVFTFDGLKRLTGLHQEKLSRIIDRLEEEGLLEKVDEGYRITRRGTEAIPRPLAHSLERNSLRLGPVISDDWSTNRPHYPYRGKVKK